MSIVEIPDNFKPQYMPSWRPFWDKRLDELNREVTFPDGSQWRMTAPLTSLHEESNCTPPEGRMVCLCELVKQADHPKIRHPSEAVMKIKIQLAPNPSEGSNPDALSQETCNEIDALEYFRERECDSAPWIIAWDSRPQGSNGLMEGGYICFILMTKLEGQSLSSFDFWSLTYAQRCEIREALADALRSIWKLKIFPNDTHPRNVLWDGTRKKCYIVDYEDYDYRPEIEGREVRNYDFAFWNLARGIGDEKAMGG